MSTPNETPKDAKYVESWCLNCANREEFDEPLTEEEAFARTDRPCPACGIGPNWEEPANAK